jgi:hypothetical protein
MAELRYIDLNNEFPHLRDLSEDEYEPEVLKEVHISKIVGLSRPISTIDKRSYFVYRQIKSKKEFDDYCRSGYDEIQHIEYRGKFYVGDNGNHRVWSVKNFGHELGINSVWAMVEKWIPTEETENKAEVAREEHLKAQKKAQENFKLALEKLLNKK